MDAVRSLQAEDEDTLNSSSEEICLEVGLSRMRHLPNNRNFE